MSTNTGLQQFSGRSFRREDRFAVQVAARQKDAAIVRSPVQRTGLSDTTAASDRRRAGEIIRALYWDKDVPNGKITVRVTNSWVILRGELLWNHQHEAALAAVCMDGMRGMSDNICVVSEASDLLNKGRIVSALSRSSFIDVRTLRVAVYRNNVTLTGKADTKTRKEEAGRISRKEAGSCRVDNQIRVRGVDGHGTVCFLPL